ncbi:DUF6531 domain-containing protein [Escherichia coli]
MNHERKTSSTSGRYDSVWRSYCPGFGRCKNWRAHRRGVWYPAGGMTSGNPVNPLLGAKVLPGETDLALPGPLPLILSRTYSSYRQGHPPWECFAPAGKRLLISGLQLRDDALVLNDNGGRSIHFEPLLPGEAVPPQRVNVAGARS